MVSSFKGQVSRLLTNQVSQILFPEAIAITYPKIAYMFYKRSGGGYVSVFQRPVLKNNHFFSKILTKWQNNENTITLNS